MSLDMNGFLENVKRAALEAVNAAKPFAFVLGKVTSVSQIESRLLVLAGIVDISGTTLNGQAGNLTLDKDAVAVRGSFTNA